MALSWTDICQALASIAGVFISLIGFIFVGTQLRQNRKALQGQTHAIIYQLAQNIYDQHILNPSMRGYFYGNQPLPEQEPERSQVMASAESLFDLFEYIVVESESLAPSVRKTWIKYMRDVYRNNSALNTYFQIAQADYSLELRQVLMKSNRTV